MRLLAAPIQLSKSHIGNDRIGITTNKSRASE